MDSTMIDFADSSSSILLPTIGDSNIEFKVSQLESKLKLKEVEFIENENDIQQAYDELCTFSLQLVKKNKRLEEKSKSLNKQLVSSKDELREKEELINCVESKFMISLNNLSNIKDEIYELKIDCDNLKKKNSKLRYQLQRQDKDSKLNISKKNLSNAQDELNKIKINCDELNKEDLNLRDTLKRQNEKIGRAHV